jgi:release factor glutamine methyltransferase
VKLVESSIAPLGSRDVRSALASAIARLESSDVPSAALAAELLLMHAVGRDRTWLYAHPEHEVDPGQASAYAGLIERRASGMPTQYLTGRQEFWGLDFEVGPGVLIPRPETEHIVEVALARLSSHRTEPLAIADVGTGSGCIAVALACELPRAQLVATDISAVALEFARRNAQRHGVSNRIEFRQMNLLDVSAQGTRFDVMVSNPPYIGRGESAQLQREVREHEPPEALFAGDRGVEFYPPLVEQARALLIAEGLLVVEVGYGHAQFVRSLLNGGGWSEVLTTRDLAGIERVISAARRSESRET